MPPSDRKTQDSRSLLKSIIGHIPRKLHSTSYNVGLRRIPPVGRGQDRQEVELVALRPVAPRLAAQRTGDALPPHLTSHRVDGHDVAGLALDAVAVAGDELVFVMAGLHLVIPGRVALRVGPISSSPVVASPVVASPFNLGNCLFLTTHEPGKGQKTGRTASPAPGVGHFADRTASPELVGWHTADRTASTEKWVWHTAHRTATPSGRDTHNPDRTAALGNRDGHPPDQTCSPGGRGTPQRTPHAPRRRVPHSIGPLPIPPGAA